MNNVKLGIIGTNFVSDWLCDAVALTPGLECRAVYSRTREKGTLFASAHNISEVYDNLDSFLASPIDAVYIASPNFLHYPQTMAAIAHGKHVLVEKPAALSHSQYLAILDSAKAHGVCVIEAMRPAHDPALTLIAEELTKIGTIRRAVFDFCQYSSRYDKYKAGEILNAFNPSLGNAAIMDIGVYALHSCVALFGSPRGVYSKSVILPNGMEGMGTAFLDYGDFQAEIVYSKITDSFNPSVITGEDGCVLIGKISLMESVSVKMRGDVNGERILLSGRFPDGGRASNMIYEVADFVKIIRGEMSAEKFNENTLVTLGIIDEIRRQNGIVFPGELSE